MSVVSFCLLIIGVLPLSAQEEGPLQPIIVNGDTVEYSTDNKEVTATGNVSVTYKGTKLTCKKLTVNTVTKEGRAEGDVRIEEKDGVIEGDKITYNFQTKAGVIIDANFRSNPYFGKTEKIDRINEEEFIARRGYITTCSLDNPHYRMKSRKVDFFIGDKIQTKDDTFYVGRLPLFYLPQYNHSLKDPLMHVQLMPGKTKDWGPYLLSAWRYNLTENIKGRIYLDYREQLGISEGFGMNYTTHKFGKGDYKYYYTQERSRGFEEGEPAEFQRYFIRWRHKWDINEQTNVTSEYYKIADSKRMIYGTEYNILKDYFYREYEKDSLPLSYISFHSGFGYSSLDGVIQKRTNRWYTQLEKLPEIKYSLPSYQLGPSPFYFENSTQAANFNYKYAVPSPSTADVNMMRLDTVNKVSLPVKIAFVRLNPFFKDQFTFYDKNIFGSSSTLRNIFYAGTEASTKFYRVFNVKSHFLGMDINGLRHIITPTITYTYNHEPSIPSSKLKQIDSVDSLTRNNSCALELSNKLQTKRDNQSVDILDFRITNNYIFKPKGGGGSSLSDFVFDLQFLPYSWLRLDLDATYNHSGARSDANYRRFSAVNYDINFNLGRERSFGLGQRYYRKGGNEITYSFNWRLDPKWKFSLYNRLERGHDPTILRGLKEQEYTISRDFHCWIVSFTYNTKRPGGESAWVIFRLKAFPELEFEFNKDYNQPKSGSQSNPSLR